MRPILAISFIIAVAICCPALAAFAAQLLVITAIVFVIICAFVGAVFAFGVPTILGAIAAGAAILFLGNTVYAKITQRRRRTASASPPSPPSHSWQDVAPATSSKFGIVLGEVAGTIGDTLVILVYGPLAGIALAVVVKLLWPLL